MYKSRKMDRTITPQRSFLEAWHSNTSILQLHKICWSLQIDEEQGIPAAVPIQWFHFHNKVWWMYSHNLVSPAQMVYCKFTVTVKWGKW